MKKQSILVVSVFTLLLTIPGVWLTIAQMQVDAQAAAINQHGGRALGGFIGGYAVILLTGAVICYLVVFIGSLIRSVSMKSWIWLPALLLGPLGTLAYGLAGPEDPDPDPPYWGANPWQQ